MQMPNVPKRVKDHRKIPLWVYVLFAVALCSLLIYVIAAISPDFADVFNGSVGRAVRAVLAHLTSWLPFSLAEMLLLLSPLGIVAITVYAYRCRCEEWRTVLVFVVSLVAAFSVLFSLFVLSFGTGYHTHTLDERMGLTLTEVSADDLYETALLLTDAVNAAADGVTFGADGFSVMPYDRGEMNERLLAAFDAVCDEYGFIQRLNSRIKPVMLSGAMSYTHVTGVYTYFTGEANLNVAFPDYTLPFTAAHELAHQRGIARENEANFVAFLVTSASTDAYLSYVAYLNLFEYVGSALYRADEARYREVLALLDARVIGELRAFSTFFDTYRDAPIADFSDAVNDTYLKAHGNEAGSASYGLVVELAVAYLK